MSGRRKLTDEFLVECRQEAQRRAEAKTNKELARIGKVSPNYVANIVSTMARAIRKRQIINVSSGTRSDETAES